MNPPTHDDESMVIDLKDRWLACLLAWLWPGAGHLYQGRTAKGLLFMVTILGTFFFGFFLGEGHVVYASWDPLPRRWPYVCQFWVGLPALPALVEGFRAQEKKEPLLENRWYAPPRQEMKDKTNELDNWLYGLNRLFEYGTVYTMIAGLLNVLAMYDAFGGPAYARSDEEEDQPDAGRRDKKAA